MEEYDRAYLRVKRKVAEVEAARAVWKTSNERFALCQICKSVKSSVVKVNRENETRYECHNPLVASYSLDTKTGEQVSSGPIINKFRTNPYRYPSLCGQDAVLFEPKDVSTRIKDYLIRSSETLIATAIILVFLLIFVGFMWTIAGFM